MKICSSGVTILLVVGICLMILLQRVLYKYERLREEEHKDGDIRTVSHNKCMVLKTKQSLESYGLVGIAYQIIKRDIVTIKHDEFIKKIGDRAYLTNMSDDTLNKYLLSVKDNPILKDTQWFIHNVSLKGD